MRGEIDAESLELRYYDQLASRYHGLHAQPVQEYSSRIEGPLIRSFVAPGARVVVVGCGGGRELAFLPSGVREVVGTDFSAEMLREAEPEMERLRERADGPVKTELVTADAAELPFEDARFDIAICLAALNYMPRYRESLAEMARILRPGGIVLVNTINRIELAARRKGLPAALRERRRAPQAEPATSRRPFREVWTEAELAAFVRDAGFDVFQTVGLRLLVDLVPDAWNTDPAKRRRAELLIRVLGPLERGLLHLPWCRRRARFVLVCGRLAAA
jgi:ubiquinone/menaquinone biosynthesis C-methylase UbiE